MRILRFICVVYIAFCCLAMPNLMYKNFKLKLTIEEYHKVSNELLVVSNEQQEIITRLLKFIDSMRTIEVNATGYTPCKTECDETPHVTAIMRKSKPGRTVAVSRDLKHLLGKEVYIKGVGVRVVEDLMNKRFESSIDIMFPTKQEAFEFGRQETKLIVLAGK